MADRVLGMEKTEGAAGQSADVANVLQKFKTPSASEVNEAKGGALTANSLPDLTLLKSGSTQEEPSKIIEDKARQVAEFIKDAKHSLHIVASDLHIADAKAQQMISDALNDDAKRGVDVRIAYPKNFNDDLLTLGFPGASKDNGNSAEIDLRHGQRGSLDSAVKTEAIQHGSSQYVMGSYIVRDGDSVLTGQGALTDNGFLNSHDFQIGFTGQFAKGFENDFAALEARKSGDSSMKGMSGSPFLNGGDAAITVGDKNASATVDFAPVDGTRLDHDVAQAIEQAHETVHIGSAYLSSVETLRALNKVIGDGKVKVDGVYNGSEMDSVEKMFKNPEKIMLWNNIKSHFKAEFDKDGSNQAMRNGELVAVDEGTAAAKAIVSSLNLSENSKKNFGSFMVINDRDAVKKVADYIKGMLGSAESK